MQSNFETIKYEKDDRIAWIKFNRPERRNALSRKVWSEMNGAVRDAKEDINTRVLVFTGEGDDFCAGLDIKEMSQVDFKGLGGFLSVALDPNEIIHRFPKPTIAAVNGYALGGGCELTCLCDFTVASEKAKFGFVENRRGLISGLALLRASDFNIRDLKELILTGKIVNAEEANRLGLVNKVVPHERLYSEVEELCQELMKVAPISQKLSKEALRRGKMKSVGELWEYFDILFNSEDMIEGFQSWLEDREPKWKGK